MAYIVMIYIVMAHIVMADLRDVAAGRQVARHLAGRAARGSDDGVDAARAARDLPHRGQPLLRTAPGIGPAEPAITNMP